MALDIEVLADADAVAERAAAFVVDQARAAAADHGRLSFDDQRGPDAVGHVPPPGGRARKVDALRRLRAGDRSVPAGRVRAPSQLVIADRAAAPQG